MFLWFGFVGWCWCVAWVFGFWGAGFGCVFVGFLGVGFLGGLGVLVVGCGWVDYRWFACLLIGLFLLFCMFCMLHGCMFWFYFG